MLEAEEEALVVVVELVVEEANNQMVKLILVEDLEDVLMETITQVLGEAEL